MTSVALTSPEKGTAEIVDVATGAITSINVGATNVSRDWLPAFSPDGKWIALVAYGAPHDYHLIVVEATGKNVQDFGQVSADDSGQVQWATDGKAIFVLGTQAIGAATAP
jgi:hypothetical protein